MKSAYELAMERMGGGDDNPLTDEQKEQIAEIDTKYKAKIAERKIFSKKVWMTPLPKAIRQRLKKPVKS